MVDRVEGRLITQPLLLQTNQRFIFANADISLNYCLYQLAMAADSLVFDAKEVFMVEPDEVS